MEKTNVNLHFYLYVTHMMDLILHQPHKFNCTNQESLS